MIPEYIRVTFQNLLDACRAEGNHVAVIECQEKGKPETRHYVLALTTWDASDVISFIPIGLLDPGIYEKYEPVSDSSPAHTKDFSINEDTMQ